MKNIPTGWNDIFDMLHNQRPTLFYCVVKWKPPDPGWIKCNTDGACRGNPGLSSYGFCIRNSAGDLIYAEADSLGISTNMDAEITAIWKALRYCQQHCFQQVILEADSLVLKNILNGIWKIPWELIEKMENIMSITQSIDIIIEHIFREGNQLADCIANKAIQQMNMQQYRDFKQLPSMARKILNLDKHQVPSLRIRAKKINISFPNYRVQSTNTTKFLHDSGWCFHSVWD